MKEKNVLTKTGRKATVALESKKGLKRFSHLLSHDVTTLKMASTDSFFEEYPDAYGMINSLQGGEVIGAGSLDELRIAYRSKNIVHNCYTSTDLTECFPTPLDHPRTFSCGSTESGPGTGLNEAPAKIIDPKDSAIFLARWGEDKSYTIYIYLVGEKQKDFAERFALWLETAEFAAEMDEFENSIK